MAPQPDSGCGWVFFTAVVLTLGQRWGGIATFVAASVSCVVTLVKIRLLGGNALRRFEEPLAWRIFARRDTRPVQRVALLRLLFQTMPTLNCARAMSGIPLRQYVVGTLLRLQLPITLYAVFLRPVARWMNWNLPRVPAKCRPNGVKAHPMLVAPEICNQCSAPTTKPCNSLVVEP